VNQSVETWYLKYVQWLDFLVGMVGIDLVFLLSLIAVAAGVQMSCAGAKRRNALLTRTGLTLTGTVALGQGTALVSMLLLRSGGLKPWWWLTAWVAMVAGVAFAAQIVQHVQLLRRLRKCEQELLIWRAEGNAVTSEEGKCSKSAE
jgi:hypothetical protein